MPKNQKCVSFFQQLENHRVFCTRPQSFRYKFLCTATKLTFKIFFYFKGLPPSPHKNISLTPTLICPCLYLLRVKLPAVYHFKVGGSTFSYNLVWWLTAWTILVGVYTLLNYLAFFHLLFIRFVAENFSCNRFVPTTSFSSTLGGANSWPSTFDPLPRWKSAFIWIII